MQIYGIFEGFPDLYWVGKNNRWQMLAIGLANV